MSLPKTGLTGLKTRKDNPITKESLSGAAKRVTHTIDMGVATGTLADATLYRAITGLTRSGKLTGAWLIFGVAPASGVNAFALKKGGSAGVTLLSAASVSVTAAAVNAMIPLTLTAVLTDLIFAGTGAEAIYAELQTGTQGTPAQNFALMLEFELDDFVA